MICLTTEKLISATLLAAMHRASENWRFASLSCFVHCMSVARSPSSFLCDCTWDRDSWKTYTSSLEPFSATLEKENMVIALNMSGEKNLAQFLGFEFVLGPVPYYLCHRFPLSIQLILFVSPWNGITAIVVLKSTEGGFQLLGFDISKGG